MSRFSPTVRPRTGREGEPRAADRIIQALDMLRRKQLQEEEQELAEEERERRRELTDLELAQRGIRRGEAPTRSVPADETPLTGDIDLGGQPGGARTRRARELESVLFPGSGPAPRMETDRGPGGMAGVQTGVGGGPNVEGPRPGPGGARGPGGTGALGADEFTIQALDQVRQQGPARGAGEGEVPGEGSEPGVRHPPGAFVPELGGFTDEPIFDIPAPDTRIGMQRPPDVETSDPRFEQLTDEFFVDRTATTEARESAEQTRMLEALGRLRNATPEQMAALEAGVDPSMVFTEEEDGREGFTEEELRRAGVPEDVIPAAVRDPVLARRAIQDAREGEEGPDLGFQDRLEDLVDSGVGRERAEAIARDPTAYRQFVENQRGPSAREDFVGRRQRAFDAAKRILDLREQTFEGGFEPSDEELRRMNQEVQQTLALFGYNDMSELQRDMRRYGLDEGAVAEEGGRDAGATETGEQQGEAGAQPEDELPPIEQRIDELIAEGLSDQEIADKLREEGYR